MRTYTVIKYLGEGSYGEVFIAHNGLITDYKEINHNELVAIKKIKHDCSSGMTTYTMREISILTSLNHPNIVKLLKVIYRINCVYLVFEYCHCGDLRKLLIRNYQLRKLLDTNMVKKWIYQLLQACKYMHGQQIIHRDLKPSNILFSQEGKYIKICDFGLSRIGSQHINITNVLLTPNMVTLWYRSPEILLGSQNYTDKVDIWSVGCILAELLTGQVLFHASCQIEMLFLQFKTLGTPNTKDWKELGGLPHYSNKWPNWSTSEAKIIFHSLFQNVDHQAIDLIQKLIQVNPKERISAKMALKHPYFENILL